MILKKITIKNFRNFDELNLKFDNRLTVIIGNNGAGKSTILDAISIAMGAYLSGYDNIGYFRIKDEDVKENKYVIGDRIDAQRQFPSTIEAEGMILKEKCKWKISKEKSNSKGIKPSEIKSVTEIAGKLQSEIRNGNNQILLPVVAYYGTGRLWNNSTVNYEYKSNRLSGYTDCMNIHLNNASFVSWFRMMTIIELQKKRVLPDFSTVKKAMCSCIENVIGTKDVNVMYDFTRDQIVVVYGKDKKTETLSELSDGYRNTLNMVADIAFRMSLLNPQLGESVITETEGIVLIDEVDLHLHPGWQQRILPDLLKIFKKVQFVVTTHAPMVINSVRKDNVVVLNNNSVDYVGIQTYGKDANSVLSAVMETGNRPVEIEKLFQLFYNALDNGEIENAKKTLTKLEDKLQDDDPELVACRVHLEFAEE